MPQMSSNNWIFYYNLIFISLIVLSVNLSYYVMSFSSLTLVKDDYTIYFLNVLN